MKNDSLETLRQNVTLLSPTRGAYQSQAYQELVARWRYEVHASSYIVRGASDISQVRSELASAWMAYEESKWSLWLDDDVVLSWSDLLNFVNNTLEYEDNYDLMAGIYAAKRAKSGVICAQFSESEVLLKDANARDPLVWSRIVQGAGEDIFSWKPIEWCGFGCVLMKRSLLKKLSDRLPVVQYDRYECVGRPYFMGMVVPARNRPVSVHVGEDVGFCLRARAAGGRLAGCTSLRLGHEGLYEYGWEDVDSRLPRYAELMVTLPVEIAINEGSRTIPAPSLDDRQTEE